MREPFETPPICDRCGICGCIGECQAPQDEAVREVVMAPPAAVVRPPQTACPHGVTWGWFCPDCEYGPRRFLL